MILIFNNTTATLMKCVESVVHTGSQKKNERQHHIHWRSLSLFKQLWGIYLLWVNLGQWDKFLYGLLFFKDLTGGNGLCTQEKMYFERVTLIAVRYLHQQCQGLTTSELVSWRDRMFSKKNIITPWNSNRLPSQIRENSQEQLDLYGVC